MSVTVVKEDGFYKDNPVWGGDDYLKYVKSNGTVTVPDMSDYYTRASNTDLRNLKDDLKEDIKDNNTQVQRKIETFSSAITTKIEGLKELVLSSERIELEIQELRKVEHEIIEHIANECSMRQESIRKEVEAFQQMDLSKELLAVLSPLEAKLQTIISKNAELMEKIGSIERMDQGLLEYKTILDNIQKEKTDCEKLLNNIGMEQKKIFVQCQNLINDKFKSLYKKIVGIVVMLFGVVLLILMYCSL